jgi:hypothetical protein
MQISGPSGTSFDFSDSSSLVDNLFPLSFDLTTVDCAQDAPEMDSVLKDALVDLIVYEAELKSFVHTLCSEEKTDLPSFFNIDEMKIYPDLIN